MALNPFVVQIERKPGSSFGETMSAVRIWLDHRDIRPTSFLPITQIDSGNWDCNWY
jgi:hypothetical protein